MLNVVHGFVMMKCSPEDRSDLKDTVHATHDGHLFEQLRGLSQATRLPKVLQREDGSAALAGPTLQLGRMDLLEPL